jgi:hypothetical protein
MAGHGRGHQRHLVTVARDISHLGRDLTERAVKLDRAVK